MIINIFKHVSRSYYDLYNAFIAAYPKKPTWIFKEMAGLFDFISELINRIATDILYPTTREAAYAFSNLCDYSPTEADGATTTLTITLVSAMAKTLPIGYQVGGVSSASGKLIIYELTAIGNSGGTDTITVAAKQKKTYTDINIGSVTSSDDFADYPIDGYLNIIKSSLSLIINSQSWSRVNNFDSSGPTDKNFVAIYQSSGKCRLGFGDNTTGQKPTTGETIYATFEVTEGLSGQVEAGDININVGGDSDILSITNTASGGGNDSEEVASMLRNARANVRFRDILWSQDDLETAAKESSASVVKALGIPGVGEAEISIIPSGGGSPGVPLKAAVKTYVEALTQFGLMPITVSDPSYSSTNVTATYTLRSGYIEATVTNLLEFAMTLITCAYDSQVIDSYNSNGIDVCRTDIINNLWAWAFTEDENDALEFIIEKWISLLGERESRDFGQSLEVGDLWIMGDSIYDYGVDEFSLTFPVANVTVSSDEIIDTGVVTITKV